MCTNKFGSYSGGTSKDKTCNFIPPPMGKGACNYYINRFKNFMERHKDCVHTPPVYYYGELREFGKLTEIEKLIIKLTTLPTRTAIIGQTDADKKIAEAEKKRKQSDTLLPQYKRNGKALVPTPTGSYGFKYCDRFTNELMPKLTSTGQAWLRQAKLDLQTYMEQGLVSEYYVSTYNGSYNIKNGLVLKNIKTNAITRSSTSVINKFYTNIELNNTKFQSFAFATHPDAYNPKRMSSLPAHDLIRIMLTPDMKEWLGAETWEQAWIMAKNMDYSGVTKATWDKLKKDTKEVIDELQESMNKEASKLKKQFNKYWDEIFN